MIRSDGSLPFDAAERAAGLTVEPYGYVRFLKAAGSSSASSLQASLPRPQARPGLGPGPAQTPAPTWHGPGPGVVEKTPGLVEKFALSL